MFTPIITGVALAAASAVVAVSPAMAEPAPGTDAVTGAVTTVTTLSVPADLAIEIPYGIDAWGDSGRITAAGVVAFPLMADEYDGNFVHQAFAMSTEAAVGCVRTVDSFTFHYTLAGYWELDQDSTPVIGGIGTGDPIALLPLLPEAVSHTGHGVLIVEDRTSWVHLDTMSESPDARAGALTIAYPNPVASTEARGYIGFSNPLNTRWYVDSASFSVTDTCTSEVVVPPVTPPVVDAPTETAATTASTPVLAATGTDAGIVASGAVIATLLLGGGAAAVLLARRRAAADHACC